MRPPTRVGLGTIAAIVAIAIAGCGRTESRTSAPKWDAAALQLPPGIPPSDLPDPDSRGARLVRQYCSTCHGIPSPASHAAEDWSATVRRMVMRMNHMAVMGGMRGMMGGGRMPVVSNRAGSPSSDEQSDILNYLRAHSMRSIDPSIVPNASDPGAGLFARTCSRCHALPDPAQHTAAQWPQVVERMRGNMRKMNVSGVDDAQASEIISYLTRNAGGGER
jgi:cytochrome c5